MIYKINEYTDFLCRAKITPNQFYICWLLHTKDFENLKKYIKEIGVFKTEELKDLISKGFILDTNPNSNNFNVLTLFVSLEFAELIIIEPEEAFEQFLEVYPDYVLVNGVKYPAKGLKFEEEKGIRELYSKIINKNKFLHLDIINIVRKWKQDNNNIATVKIDKFIIGKHWEILSKDEENGIRPKIY